MSGHQGNRPEPPAPDAAGHVAPEEIVEGPPEAVARLFAPAQHRGALAALDAWRRALLSLPDTVRDPGVARVKLSWWSEELERLRAGTPRHPASQALHRSWPADALPEDALAGFVAAVSATVDGAGFGDWDALAQHAWDTEGGYFAAAMGLAGTHTVTDARTAEAAARPLGLSVYLVRVLDRLPSDLRRDRLYLPRSLMADHGLRRSDLRPDRPRTALHNMLEEIVLKSCNHYDSFQDILPRLPPEARPFPAVAARLHQLELARWCRPGPAVLDTGWTRPGALRRLLTAWAAARAARRGRSRPIRPPRFRNEPA